MLTEQTVSRPGPSDDEVFRAAAAGDPDARDDLYRRYRRVVHGVVLGVTGPGDVEDVTQEVFMVVFDKLQTVRDSEALGGWVCSVARHVAIDHARKRSRTPDHEPLGDVSSRRDDPARTTAHQILEHIRALPEAYREPLILRLVEGMTGPEIAEHTGMTHGSVRVNLCKGMALLRPALERSGLP